MTDDDQVVSWVVSGRVQGVGFRWHTARIANQLGVRGWVRNNQNGQVEVLGVADRSVLDEFEKQLWIGPSLSRVDNVDKISKQLDVSNIKSFDII